MGPGATAGLYGPPGCAQPPSGAGGRDDEARRRIEVAGLVALGVVLPARDERVELDSRRVKRRQLARGRDEHACPPCLPDGRGVTGGEVDAVDVVELLPRQRAVVPGRTRLVADTVIVRSPDLVDVTETAPLGLFDGRRVDADTGALQPHAALRAEVVAAEPAEERGAARKPRQLDRCNPTAAGRLGPGLGRARRSRPASGRPRRGGTRSTPHARRQRTFTGALSQMRPPPR